MTYTYVHVSPEQVFRVKELLRVFGEAFEDMDTYQGAVPTDKYLQNLLDKPQFIALVALAEGEVIGGLAAYVLEKFDRSGGRSTSTILPFRRGTEGRASQRD